MYRTILFTAAASLATVTVASAATVDVCPADCDFTTIQAASDSAAPGDTVRIAPGAYAESLVVDDRVWLVARSESMGTVVVAGDGERPVLTRLERLGRRLPRLLRPGRRSGLRSMRRARVGHPAPGLLP